MTGGNRKRTPIVCIAPTTDYRWSAFNSANTCNAANGTHGSGGSCSTTGNTVDGLTPQSGSIFWFQDTTANRPTYKTAALNGKPSILFTAANAQNMGSSGIPYLTSFTAYVVYKHGTTGGIIASCGGTTVGCVELFDNGTNFQFNNLNRNVIATGTHTLTVGNWYVSVTQYNFTTGAASLFLCSGGTCIVDGTGSLVSGNWGFNVTTLGGISGGGYFNSELAEFGWTQNNTSINSAIATYVQCQYGI